MDLKQLEYFVRVAELGSFTRASIVLDVAQPALSRQIRSLEVELRQNLLIRNGRGVTLTEAGKVLLEHSRGILHQVERAKEELGRVRNALAGRVALGLPPSLSRVLTLPLTRVFRERMPDAALCIREGLSTTMLESLQSGRLDIALVHNAAPTPDIETQPLMDEELFVVTRDQGALTHPHTLAELAGLPLIIPSRPNAIRMLVETEMARAGLRPRIELEIDAVSAILDLVAEGAGVAVLGRQAIHTSNRPLLLQAHPLSPALYSQLSIAVSAQRPATLTQQAVIGLIRELVGGSGEG
ncbi:LysR substrate-binding domain-containing protein [Zoogloea sp.]|uniref:LysR substrate-binding domain-containing protein n=2 Tax=Zoogloea sp. TaxID=49181 RepID=UPI0035AFE0A6